MIQPTEAETTGPKAQRKSDSGYSSYRLDWSLREHPKTKEMLQMREKIAHVIHALENLRLEYLYSSLGGLPLPTAHQLEAVVRLRPSSLNACPGGVIPTWSQLQTSTFGQVFLEKLEKVCIETGLSFDVYAQTMVAAIANNDKDEEQNEWSNSSERVSHQIVSQFNCGQPITEIARRHSIDEARVLAILLQAEDKGSSVTWTRMSVSSCLKDSVMIAAEVARHMEKAAAACPRLHLGAELGGIEPFSKNFPLPILMQLLPDWRPADVLAGICVLRQTRSKTRSPCQQRTGLAKCLKADKDLNKEMEARGSTASTSMSEDAHALSASANCGMISDENNCPNVAAGASVEDTGKSVHRPEEQEEACPPLRERGQAQRWQCNPYHDNNRHPADAKGSAAAAMLTSPHPQPATSHAAKSPAAPNACILAMLSVHSHEGLSASECLQLLSDAHCGHRHALGNGVTTVEACLGELQENYVAYRGGDGKFRLL